MTGPKPTSHLHKERIFFGESDGKVLTDWLNSKPPEKARAAVKNFLAVNAELGAAPSKKQLRAAKIAYDNVYDLVSPTGFYIAGYYEGLTMPEVVDGRVQWIGSEVPHGPNYEEVPCKVFASLIALANSGLLDRVRQCGRPGCGEFFYARFAHQRFHSLRCQQIVFQSDPEWKRKRADAMRRQRHDQKLLEQRRNPKGEGGK